MALVGIELETLVSESDALTTRPLLLFNLKTIKCRQKIKQRCVSLLNSKLNTGFVQT